MKENKLLLIPKSERYIQYMVEIITKLPRTEKFNIGTEYKQSMYNMLRKILYLSKIDNYTNTCLADTYLLFLPLGVSQW